MPFIFVIGLPGSGKSTFLKTLQCEHPDAIILDDSLGFGNIRKLEIRGEKDLLIIADPRLTNPKTFAFLTKYLTNIVKIYVYENNVSNCIHNVTLREGQCAILQLLLNDINNMSQMYNVDLFYSDKWKTIVLPVMKY